MNDQSSKEAGHEQMLTIRVNASLVEEIKDLASETVKEANSGKTFPEGYVERLRRVSSGIVMGINERPDLGREQPKE